MTNKLHTKNSPSLFDFLNNEGVSVIHSGLKRETDNYLNALSMYPCCIPGPGDVVILPLNDVMMIVWSEIIYIIFFTIKIVYNNKSSFLLK